MKGSLDLDVLESSSVQAHEEWQKLIFALEEGLYYSSCVQSIDAAAIQSYATSKSAFKIPQEEILQVSLFPVLHLVLLCASTSEHETKEYLEEMINTVEGIGFGITLLSDLDIESLQEKDEIDVYATPDVLLTVNMRPAAHDFLETQDHLTSVQSVPDQP